MDFNLEKNFLPCLIKIYDEPNSDLKLNDVYEFIGIFTFNPELVSYTNCNGDFADDLCEGVSAQFPPSKPKRRPSSLKEQLSLVAPILEDLRMKKEERVKQFADIKAQIEKISGELSGYTDLNDKNAVTVEEHDLSLRKLNEYQLRFQSLQKEKSDRLHKVLESVNEVHCLCALLGVDFGEAVGEVHPSLHEMGNTQCKNISNDTLVGLAQSIGKLKMEKKARIQKLKDTASSLFELWNLMDTPEEEMKPFGRITDILGSSESDIKDPGILSSEIIKQLWWII